MKISQINGKPVPWKRMLSNSMSFGRPVKSLTPYPYLVALSSKEFIELLEPAYQRFVAGEQDETEVDDDYPELLQLQKLGFPSLREMIQDQPELLSKLIREHLPGETFAYLFPTPESEVADRDYVIQTLDELSITPMQIRFKGIAYSTHEKL